MTNKKCKINKIIGNQFLLQQHEQSGLQNLPTIETATTFQLYKEMPNLTLANLIEKYNILYTVKDNHSNLPRFYWVKK